MLPVLVTGLRGPAVRVEGLPAGMAEKRQPVRRRHAATQSAFSRPLLLRVAVSPRVAGAQLLAAREEVSPNPGPPKD